MRRLTFEPLEKRLPLSVFVATQEITNYSGSNWRINDPVTSDGEVAWLANPTSPTQAPNIYVYDTAGGSTTKITNYSGTNWRINDPVTSEGEVAWLANPTSPTQAPNIYVYDTAAGSTISTSRGASSAPPALMRTSAA